MRMVFQKATGVPAAVFLIISWIFVLGRVYVRAYMKKSWGHDDTFLVFSLVFFTVECSFAIIDSSYGIGMSLSDVPFAYLSHHLRFDFISKIFYICTCVSLRISISLFLIRLKDCYVLKCIVWTIITINLLFGLGDIFATIFQCWPVYYYWGQFELYQPVGSYNGKCFPINVIPDITIAQCALWFVSDWILGLIPIAIMRSLQIDRRTKIMVEVLLGLGVLAGLVALIRIPFLIPLRTNLRDGRALTAVKVLSLTEPALGLIAASLVTLRPLLRALQEGTLRPDKNVLETYENVSPHIRPTLRNEDSTMQLRKDVGDGGLTNVVTNNNRPSNSDEDNDLEMGWIRVERAINFDSCGSLTSHEPVSLGIRTSVLSQNVT